MMIHFKSKNHKIIFIIFALLLCLSALFIKHNLTKDDPIDYFNNHKGEFDQIAEYFNDNAAINFDVCDEELDDLEKISDCEVVNSIRNIISDGVVFEIINYSTSQVEVAFICSNVLVKTGDTIAIVYSTQDQQDEISYKGDNIEYINVYEQLDNNWYRKYRD